LLPGILCLNPRLASVVPFISDDRSAVQSLSLLQTFRIFRSHHVRRLCRGVFHCRNAHAKCQDCLRSGNLFLSLLHWLSSSSIKATTNALAHSSRSFAIQSCRE